MPIGSNNITIGSVALESRISGTANSSLNQVYALSNENGFVKSTAGNYHNTSIGTPTASTYGNHIANSYINLATNYQLGFFAGYDHTAFYTFAYQFDLGQLDVAYTIQVDIYIVDENNLQELIYSQQLVGGATYDGDEKCQGLKSYDTNANKYLSYRVDMELTLIAGSPDPQVTNLAGSDADNIGQNQTRYADTANWVNYVVTSTPSGQAWAVDGDNTGNPTICGNKRTLIQVEFGP